MAGCSRIPSRLRKNPGPAQARGGENLGFFAPTLARSVWEQELGKPRFRLMIRQIPIEIASPLDRGLS